jgi:ATP-dependent Clp protease ATP-binding subunit ClpA
MVTEQIFTQDSATPRWIKDVFRFLSVKSQFVLSGNIRDRYPFLTESASSESQTARYTPLGLTHYLSEALQLRGYEYFIEYNRIEGFSPVGFRSDQRQAAIKFFSEHFQMTFDSNGSFKCSLEKSIDLIDRIVAWKENFVAVFLDYASRYTAHIDGIQGLEHEYFSKALIMSHYSQPHNTQQIKEAQFNSVFWLCDKENDVPDWLVINNPRVRSVIIPKPDHMARRTLISLLTPSMLGHSEATTSTKEQCHEEFVEQTEGLVLMDVIAITQLCRREGLKFEDIGEAVRRYKLGVTEDPWKRLDRKNIAQGDELIGKRLKGQHQAIVKSLDIIKRAVTGLSGAQGSRVGGRPRGVLFLAGPTGTGKTELAKTLTELLFGDERAYIRFDMSEFSAEHSDQRLIGAPPGYIGSDMGGELTNAIREKPFSVLLFDEIEKAHPRILDKFLQILDDGVLTSGRGERVYFSETVIIFTSNLGIYKIDREGHRIPNVVSTDSYEIVEQKVREEIENYFKIQLSRPEILNRIGENIVVFDFIRQDIADKIFDKMVGNILDGLAERQKITVHLADTVKATLREHCLRDLNNGGRGIGNQLEALLINPLGRALFDANVAEEAELTVESIDLSGTIPSLNLK